MNYNVIRYKYNVFIVKIYFYDRIMIIMIKLIVLENIYKMNRDKN